MSLKEEIEKIEEEERLLEEEDARQIEREGIDEKIAGLYLRIDVIVEYLDQLANAEEETKSDYVKGYENGVNSEIKFRKETNESKEVENKKKNVVGLGKEIGDV